MNALLNFILMNGYGTYIWTAYGIVLVALGLQWFVPWRRWRIYQRSMVLGYRSPPKTCGDDIQHERNT